jgi:UDP-glucose 4-epimerase
MHVLVTGGAGYIGSQIAWMLNERGYKPIILDDLSTGYESQVGDFPLFKGRIDSSELIDRIFEEYPVIHTVIHCAAKIVVPESVSYPIDYYENNVACGLRMLRLIGKRGVKNLIFSSTAAIYDTALSGCVDENASTRPVSPYSWSKFFFEQILNDFAKVNGIKYLALRYFNPIGADINARCGNMIRQPSHLLGSLIRATQNGEPFNLYGVSWPTRDGTAMRDFIDVVDLARAHVRAVDLIDSFSQEELRNAMGLSVMNIGTGRGVTVREFISAYKTAIDPSLKVREVDARPGDVRGNFADNGKASALLRWEPIESLGDSMRRASTWARTLAVKVHRDSASRFWTPSDGTDFDRPDLQLMLPGIPLQSGDQRFSSIRG